MLRKAKDERAQDSSISAKDRFISKLKKPSKKQNELIFATRKRLFQLERTQNKDVRILCAMSIALGVVMLLMCLEFGGFTW